jgi:3-deoxy-7-phosphoheptulonate synthase
MIVRMEAGIGPDDPRVKAVRLKAVQYGLDHSTKEQKGTRFTIVEVCLLDGEKVRSRELSEHIFRLEGVDTVERVTPSMVTLACQGKQDAHHIKLGPSLTIGHGLPCVPIIGPCTVDKNVGEIVRNLALRGVKAVRGGCWKPRSSAYSPRGFGKKAVRWLLEAAGKTEMEAVFLEVLESKHINVVRNVCAEVGYEGTIVLWVGARSAGNTELLASLGEQTDFPVMIKNGLHERRVQDLFGRVEFVLAGPMHWHEDGSLDEERSRQGGNNRVMLCARGTEQLDPDSPFRFMPNHGLIEAVHKKSWAPCGVDPSHSAGTMRDDLVLRNLESALAFGPDFALVEGGYPAGLKGLCDVDQSVPLSRIPEVLDMIAASNARRFPKSTLEAVA